MTDPHELFSDRLIHAYRRSWTIFVHGAAVAVALAGFLLTELPAAPVLVWFTFMLSTMGYHSYLGKRLVAEERRAMSGISTRPLTIFAALAGLGWGAAAAFLPYVSPALQLLVILTLMSIAAASLPRMAALPVIHAAFMAGLFIPMLIALLLVFGLDHWMMAVVLLIIWGGLTDETRKANAELIELYSTRQALEEETVRDKLTGIPNRRSFDATLEREWQRAHRLKAPLSLIMIDVDFFKRYNDRYGHQAGDACLAKVAQSLAAGPRRAGDMVARYGGEEFVALLFHTPRDDALCVAEGMRRNVEALAIPHEDCPAGTVSVSLGGATCIPVHECPSATLLRAADAALYEAKADGRNRVVWATEETLSSAAKSAA